MALPYDLVILDRDGVINVDRAESVRSPHEFLLLPGVADAIALLNAEKVPVVIATNQAVVGRGDLSLGGLDAIHAHMAHLLNKAGAHIDHIFYCTDVDGLTSNRRKPAPGMLFEAMDRYDVSPNRTVMIGDAMRDFDAAHCAGCDFYLVRTGHGEHTEKELKNKLLSKTLVGIADDLRGAVYQIRKNKKGIS